MSSSISSSSSDESYVPHQKSRRKRYSKVKNRKLSMNSRNSSCAASASSSFNESMPSCSGYRALPSSEVATSISSDRESNTSHSFTTPSKKNSSLNDIIITCFPASLGIKNKPVVLSERQKRWHRVAEENKELLEKVNFSHYHSLNNSPLLENFRKKKSDPEFRRSLNRPSKAIKVFSDEEEDKSPNKSSNFPFSKEYDDKFRNLKIYESDEEFSEWLKDTKRKRKLKSSYKGGPLADEHLLPLDYKELFESDSEYFALAGMSAKEEKKKKLPLKAKSLDKGTVSSIKKISQIKKLKSATRKLPSIRKMKTGERNLPLPSLLDDNLNETYSENGENAKDNSFSSENDLPLKITFEEFGESSNNGDKLQYNECFAALTDCQLICQSIPCLNELKSSVEKPHLGINKKCTAKKPKLTKNYVSRESKNIHKCKGANSLIPEKNITNNFSSVVPPNENVIHDSGSLKKSTKNLYRLNSNDDLGDQCLEAANPELPVGDLPSSLLKKCNDNAKKDKIKLLCDEYIFNGKIPRVFLIKMP